MRRAKEPEIRRNEILDAAQKLFAEKGYANTTVTDILNVHGLSKGVFYYYFKSKEDVMDAIVDKIVDKEVANAKLIAANMEMSPSQKLFAILMGQGISEQDAKSKEEMVEQFHIAENAQMHQKSLVQSIKHLSPVLAEILLQGAQEGVFTTDYPQETVELFFAAGQTIFDQGLFNWSPEEMATRAAAYIEMMEKTLGAEPGYFDEVKAVFS